MHIADRIQHLRKTKGLSQEDLADRIGVSRQAVSKWESEQSIPDIERVIILSDFFGVTTDYLLKGIENENRPDDKKENASIFAIVASVLNVIGLSISAAVWYERQTAAAIVIGIVFMTLGCMVFGIGLYGADPKSKPRLKVNFWSVNIWLLAFMPLSFGYNVLLGKVGAPYPLPMRPLIAFPVFWLVYVGICLSVVFFQLRSNRKK